MSRLEEIKEHVQGLMDLITDVDGNGELFKKLSHMLVDINMDHQTIINELTSICKEVLNDEMC